MVELVQVVDIDDVVKRLDAWLVVRERRGVRIDNVEVLSGGFSQFMVAFDLHEESAGPRRLVLRASRPVGEAITDTDRRTEWEVIRALSEIGDVTLPRPLWFDSGEAMGVPCFVVEHVEGPNLSHHLTAEGSHDEAADGLAQLLHTVHQTAPADIPEVVDRPSSWSAHVDSLIDKWREVERTGLEPDPIVRYLAQWLAAHKPPEAPLCLVHGEMNNDNVLVAPDGGLVAVDWEFAHIGDPREDLGWYRTVSAVRPPDLIGHDVERFCARYRELSGLSEEIINPLTIAYFGILSSVSVYSTLVQAPAAVEAGPNAPVLSGYMSSVLAGTHLLWMDAVSGLEAALTTSPTASLAHQESAC